MAAKPCCVRVADVDREVLRIPLLLEGFRDGLRQLDEMREVAPSYYETVKATIDEFVYKMDNLTLVARV